MLTREKCVAVMGADSVTVSEVMPEQIESVFAAALPMIERALSHGAGDSTTIGDLYRSALSGDITLWAVHDDSLLAVVMLSVHQYAAKKSLFVDVIAGKELARWQDAVQKLLRECAKLVGADTIEASCRAGLARRLMRGGQWRQKAVLMELTI